MKSHRQFVRRLRRLAIGLVAIGALVSVSAASALEDPGSSPSAGNAAARIGDTPADFPGAERARPASLSSRPRGSATRRPTSPARAARPTYRRRRSRSSGPRRTVVRDVNEVLPIALSGAALLIVLMGAAFVLVRVRLQHRTP